MAKIFLMQTCDIKPSLRVLTLVSQIERFSGFWEHVSEAIGDTEERRNLAIIRGAQCALLLDTTTPANIKPYLEEGATEESSTVQPPELVALIAAHNEEEFSLTVDHLNDLHRLICATDLKLHRMLEKSNANHSANYYSVEYRSTSLLFITESKEPVFSTVPSFLIPSKLRELLDWTTKELDRGSIHPLLVISVFYLVFLQIHPFSEATPRLAIVLSWHLLIERGYGFVTAAHFATHLANRSRSYFQALRQAEKTVNTNWSTLNSWLEFFLETLLESANELQRSLQRSNLYARLTTVQKQIIEAVKTNGAASRDHISRETGINLSTVKYNLTVLSRRGHLKRQGGGRTTNYSIY